MRLVTAILFAQKGSADPCALKNPVNGEGFFLGVRQTFKQSWIRTLVACPFCILYAAEMSKPVCRLGDSASDLGGSNSAERLGVLPYLYLCKCAVSGPVAVPGVLVFLFLNGRKVLAGVYDGLHNRRENPAHCLHAVGRTQSLIQNSAWLRHAAFLASPPCDKEIAQVVATSQIPPSLFPLLALSRRPPPKHTRSAWHHSCSKSFYYSSSHLSQHSSMQQSPFTRLKQPRLLPPSTP